MTNKEYIEKNNISFSDAMKMYDNEKYPRINDWLNQEHQEHKFKDGDFVKCLIDNNYIGIVIDVKDKVYFKKLCRDGSFGHWELLTGCDNIYHRDDQTIYYMDIEDVFEKIF